LRERERIRVERDLEVNCRDVQLTAHDAGDAGAAEAGVGRRWLAVVRPGAAAGRSRRQRRSRRRRRRRRSKDSLVAACGHAI
jgi:hypothetical protein